MRAVLRSSQPASAPATIATRIGMTGAGFESVPAAPMRSYSKTLGFLTIFALRLASLTYAASRLAPERCFSVASCCCASIGFALGVGHARARHDEQRGRTVIERRRFDRRACRRARRLENRRAQRRRDRRIAAADETRRLGGDVQTSWPARRAFRRPSSLASAASAAALAAATPRSCLSSATISS